MKHRYYNPCVVNSVYFILFIGGRNVLSDNMYLTIWVTIGLCFSGSCAGNECHVVSSEF